MKRDCYLVEQFRSVPAHHLYLQKMTIN